MHQLPEHDYFVVTIGVYSMEKGSPDTRRKSASGEKGDLDGEISKSTGQPSSQQNDEQYKNIFDFNPDALFILNSNGQILDANETAIKRYGYSREELSRMTAKDLATPELRRQATKRVQEALESGAHFEWKHRTKAGEQFDVEIRAHRFQYQGQTCALSDVRDITKRKQAERQMTRLKRLYATLSQINQSIVRIKEPRELYAAICKIVVRYGEFDFAWIGLLDEETGLIDPVTLEGKHKQNQLPFERINIHEAPFNKGLMAAAIYTGKVVTYNDIQTSQNMEHWCEEAIQRGYHSAAAVPFRLKEKIAGVLNLFTPELGFFTVVEEINLLEEISLDISFALEAMETETYRKRAKEELQKSEEHYRGLFEDVPIAIWEEDFSSVKEYLETLRKQGIVDFRSYFTTHPEEVAKCAAMVRIVDVNPAALKMYRVKNKEDLLKNLKQILSTQALSNFHEELITIADGNTSYRWEGTDQTLTGKEFEVYLSWSVAPGHEDDYSKVIASMLDITERKQAEAALRESERHYRLLAENVKDVIWTMDMNLRSTYTSPSVKRMRGYEPEDAMAQSLEEALTPASFEVATKILEEELAIDKMPDRNLFRSRTLELEVLCKDGSTVWVETTMIFLRDPDRKPAEILGVNRDITERKQAEEEIRSRSRQLAALLDASQSLTESLNLADVLQTITDKAAKVLNLETTAIYLLENDDLYLGATTPPLPSQFPEEFRIAKLTDHPHIGEAVTTGLPIILPDTATAALTVAERAVSEARGLRTILYVPLMRERRAVGVLILGIVREPGEFSKNDIDSACSLANQAALAVINAKLYENLENHIEKLEEQITERRKAEDALRWAEAKYHALVVQIPAVIYTDSVEHPGHTLYISPQLKTMTGYDPEEWIADDNLWLKILHAEDLESAAVESDRSIETGEQFISEYRMITRQGQIIWIHDEANLIHDETGRPLYWQGILLDITERKRAEEQIKNQLGRLKALRAIDVSIKSSFDLRVTLNIFLEQVIAQLKVDAAAVLLYKKSTQTLEHAISYGFHSTVIQSTRLRLGESHAGRIIVDQKTICIPDLSEKKDRFSEMLAEAGEKFITFVGVPLLAKGEPVGVLEVFNRTPLDLEPEWLDFLEALADQAAIAIDNAQLFENLQRSNLELSLAYDATIEGWSRALDLRDEESEGHSQRVTDMALQLARLMGIHDAELIHIRRGALLHDMGKLSVPDSILLKPGKLTDEEWEIMRRHPIHTFKMLSHISHLQPALDIPYYHHEKWDGSGYPHGLKGDQIPIAARIFAVVDVWDALLSDRPYRAAWSKRDTLKYIREQSGKHFDPEVVDVFLRLITDE